MNSKGEMDERIIPKPSASSLIDLWITWRVWRYAVAWTFITVILTGVFSAAAYLVKIFLLQGSGGNWIWPAVVAVGTASLRVIVGCKAIAKIRAEEKLMFDPLHPADSEEYMRTVDLPDLLAHEGYEKVFGGAYYPRKQKGARIQGSSVVSLDINEKLSKTKMFEIDSSRREIPRFICERLRKFPVFPYLEYSKWVPPKECFSIVRAFVKSVNTSDLTNDSKIRMCSDIVSSDFHEISGKCVLHTERTDYFSDIGTGQQTGILISEADGRERYDGWGFAFRQNRRGNELKLFNDNGCSNQIGGSVFLISLPLAKGELPYFTLVDQGAQNVQSPGLLAPAGSGSFDWDTDFLSESHSLPKAGMLREMLEETTGCSGKNKKGKNLELYELLVNRPIAMKVTGYGRMLHRGGKPEFYGLVIMPRDRGEFKKEEANQKGQYLSSAFRFFEIPDISPSGFATQVGELAKTELGNGADSTWSHPLYICALLAAKFAESQPAEFEKSIAEISAAMECF